MEKSSIFKKNADGRVVETKGNKESDKEVMIVEARLRVEVSICEKEYGFMYRNNHRCNIYFEDASVERQRRSEGAALSLYRSRERL